MPSHSLTVRTPITPSFADGGRPLPIYEEETSANRHSNNGNGTYSVISSRMTEYSEDASEIMGLSEAQQSQAQSQVSPRSSTGGRPMPISRVSVGEMMDSFSTRPSTAMSSSTANPGQRNWPSTSTNPRGMSSVGGGSVRGRPTSSASRTHAPGVANQAFYRPMSSAKLQAQRGRVTEEDDFEQQQQRRIIGFAHASAGGSMSIPVAPHNPQQQQQNLGYARQTSISTIDHTSRGAPSMSSNSPLRNSYEPSQPASLAPPSPSISRMPRTPNSRGGSSNGSRSSMAPKHRPQLQPREKVGKNYEYFPGNMRFCLGGRFQTARDFPMNIMTGILVIIPAALFFGYS